MNLWAGLKSFFSVGFGGVSADNFVSSIEWKYGLDDVTASPYAVDPYTQSGTVAVGVSTIASDAASIEWEVYPNSPMEDGDSDDEEDRIENDPVLDLFAKPNAYMNGQQLWTGSYVSYKLWGETAWYYPNLIPGRAGGPDALRRSIGTIELLDPRGVLLRFDGQGNPIWTLRRDGEDVVLDSDYLTLFKRFNPYNPWRGLSELASIMIEIQGDYAAATWNRNYFSDQNGVPAGLLKPSPDSAIRPEDKESLERKFNAKHGRMRRAVGVLPPGWSWEDLGVSQRDMDFKALREYSREQILAVLGLPPFYAGVLDKANYANAREQKDVYWNGTISRLMKDFQATLNSDFLPKIGRTDIELYPCWEEVRALLEDMNEKADIARKFFEMGYTRSQINERLQLGFDVTINEDSDVGYLPINITTVEMTNEGIRPGMTNPLPQPLPVPPDEIAGGSKPGAPQAALPPGKRMPPLHDPEIQRHKRRVATWRSLDARTRDLEARFNRIVRKNFQDIETEALASVRGLKGWSIARGLIKVDDGNLFDSQDAKKKLQKATQPVYAETLRRGTDSALSEIGIHVNLPEDSPIAVAELAKLTGKITGIIDTVEQDLRASLIAGVADGDSPSELADRVSEVMDASKNRSMTIARTEVGTAFQAGRFTTMLEAGVDRIEWLTAKDDRVRDSHAEIDGQITYVGTPFGNGLLYPLDPSGPPGEVINCRCVAVPVIDRAS